MEAINAHQLCDSTLREMNNVLSESLGADVIFINSAIYPPLDDRFRVEIEKIIARGKPKNSKLFVILETNGGSIETVERLVVVMRKHYREVHFIIPSHAFSAGTVLALSGDKIFMDYYSVLGPIDPQYLDDNGDSLLPGAGYLAKFEELTKTINNAEHPGSCRAEMSYLIKKFDPAKLFHIEQAIEHGETLIGEWLPKYKFKNWRQTSSGKRVTKAMREERAKSIASILGEATKWHSHGRGISKAELEGDEIKLTIDDFGDDVELNRNVRNYHGLAIDLALKKSIRGFIHSGLGLRCVT